MSESSEREEQIFNEALAVPPMERRRLIEAACRGDDELRKRIEALIHAHESAGAFMAAPPGPEPAGEPPSSPPPCATSEAPGTYIGRYKLLQKIGEGGCGAVWMAEQEKPVRRRVALKIIKLGMDTKEVIARFEAERQALAMMDHPNIAKIMDAGASDAGRPYFVMELVRGIRITDYCDQYNLSTRQRLELFSQVCLAIQHAHQKGIIHRDLKPSNIMVTLHDGLAVPKVIDFGIAKATEGRLTDHTLFTAFEQFIGTPSYMSPEQAEMSGIDIDTRSDIYSLGVLLYELLTGRPPFDPKSLVRAGLDEIRRIIREVEPPKPSTNLSTLSDADRITVARLRGTDPAKLSLLLRGDLDWIVMRCLEKNRTRRYETPTALAADIVRHLNDEPVVARPPSKLYRFGKLVRRNRLVFAAAGAGALALLAGSVISTWQAVRATRAERLASVERAHVEDLLTFMLGDLRSQLEKVARLDVLESVGDKAMAYFAALSPKDLNDTDLARHARALTQIGQIRIAQARYADAAAAFAEAYSRAAVLAARHPSDGDLLFERGQAEYWVGFVHWQRGEFADADVWLTRYYNTSVALVALDPSRTKWQSEVAWGHHNVGALRQERGDFAGARSDFIAELATLEKMAASDSESADLRYRIADAHSWLGGLAEQQGEFGEAMKQYSMQASQFERLAQADPGSVGHLRNEANALLYQVDIEMATGRFASAAGILGQAQNLLEALVAHDPSNLGWRGTLLNARLKKAFLARQQGETADASRILNEVLPHLEGLSATESTDRKFALRLATAWRLNAQLQSTSGDPEATASATNAVTIGKKLISEGRATDSDIGECALAYIVSGSIAEQSGDHSEARRCWSLADELIAQRARGSADWRLLDPAARAAALTGRVTEARALEDKLKFIGYVPLDPWPGAGQPNRAKDPVTQPKQ